MRFRKLDPKVVVAVKGEVNSVGASRILGCTPATVIRWCELGRLEARREGRGWRIPVSQFERVRLE